MEAAAGTETQLQTAQLTLFRVCCVFRSSFTCGLAGALASNPVDVVRTRMMNQRVMTGGPMYKGTLDGLMQTWKNEGFFALYKGFWPNWLRLGPWNIIVSFKTHAVLHSQSRRKEQNRERLLIVCSSC